MFSIIIPTFNNIEYLKLCIESIYKNSYYNHQIIVHINEGTDGTINYVKEKELTFSYSKINEGVCVAFNNCARKANSEYIVLGHDDMYFCPKWDTSFEREISKTKEEDFFLSGSMIQSFNGHINLNCGSNPKNFNEKKLLEETERIKFNDFQGTHWQPSLIPIKTWNKVGGFSEEFSPGLGSDPDFNMKLWKEGVRLFKGLGDCRVYHFSSVSLRKKAWNNGSKTFLKKWGISIKFFKKYFLRTHDEFEGLLSNPQKNIFYYFELIKCKINLFYLKFNEYLFSR